MRKGSQPPNKIVTAANKILAMVGYTRTSVGAAEKFDPNSLILPYFKEDGNNFPNILKDMYERGSIHRAAVQLKHTLACGDGIIVARKDGQPYDRLEALESWLAKVNPQQSAYEVMSNQLLDVVICGAVSGQVTGEKIGTTVYHEDFSTIRLATPEKDKEIDSAYISNMWGTKDLLKPDKSNLEKYATKLPLFNGSAETSLLIGHDYSYGRKYYPIPDYYSIAFKRWVDIEYKIPTYNDSRIDNKFMPSGFLSLFGDPPADYTPQAYAQQVHDAFTGEGQNSKLIIQMLQNKESAPTWLATSDEPDGIFMDLDTLTQQNILRGHRMHPALLMSTAGSLGQSSEIKTLFELFYATVIDGYQKKVCKWWDTVLEHAGFGEYTLSIANNNPVSLLGNIDISKYLSVNEVRTELGYDAIEESIKPEMLAQLKDLAKDVSLTQDQRRVFAILLGLEEEKALLLFPKPEV